MKEYQSVFKESITSNVTRAIDSAKKRLIAKAQRKGGIWENFGQDEVRAIEDKFVDISNYSSEMNTVRKIIDNFNEWCMTYTGFKEGSHPGKFEGEPDYVEYFYDIGMEGGADEDDGEVWTFEINADDIRQFPELRGYKYIDIEVSDQGFVYHQLRKH